jgi:hypothetical protein
LFSEVYLVCLAQRSVKTLFSEKNAQKYSGSHSTDGETNCGQAAGIDKMRERASAARRHLLNFCRHILKY